MSDSMTMKRETVGQYSVTVTNSKRGKRISLPMRYTRSWKRLKLKQTALRAACPMKRYLPACVLS